MEETGRSAQQYGVGLELPPQEMRPQEMRSGEPALRIEKSIPETSVPDESLTRAPRMEDKSPESDDFELLRKSAAGDAKAFHLLVDRHSQRMFRLAVSLVGSAADAEDVLQETFTGAFRGMGRFEGRSSVKTWLTRILVTQAARWRRDRKRRSADSMDAAPEGASGRFGIAGGEAGVEQRIDLAAALKQLSPEHREVVVLREYEQLAYDEIAQVLGVPRGTVESRLHRARLELREKLKAYLPEI
jgi:RNA polymerase sigma-70 factor (ECF subfamily)